MSKTDLGSPATYLLAGAILALGIGLAWSSSLATAAPEEVARLEPLYAPPAETTEDLTLGNGETLGRVLWNQADLTANEQESFLDAFREEASPRRLAPGTRITLRRTPDGWLRGMEVSLSPDETLRLERDDPVSWRASTFETPTTTDTLFVNGSIESMLWYAVLRNPDLETVPALDRVAMIHRLDQVFQWQVDFSRQIREGDRYRFVFEREVRPDGSMRTGQIIAAELVNQGTAYRAFRFDPNGDGRGTYYDEEGRSVRRAFLRKPLEFRYISSRFNPSRFHPVLKTWRAHTGVDYAANRGTPVMATGDGVVIHAGPDGGYGNMVEIRHPNGFRTRYAHLQGFADGIRSGTRVRQGQEIAYVGSTGLATGPHLHYELRRNGEARDPLAIELPPGDPVPEDRWEEWTSHLDSVRALMDRIPGDARGSEPSPLRTAGIDASTDAPSAGEDGEEE
ncbi:MAG: M23 family metallopeptidase [Gemmatimonadota bacterium]